MEVREIRALITLMDEYGLTELEVEDRKGKIRLVRGSNSSPAQWEATPAMRTKTPTSSRAARPSHADNSAAPPVASGPLAELAANQKVVESPIFTDDNYDVLYRRLGRCRCMGNADAHRPGRLRHEHSR